jgi:hypothetical protein
MQSEQRQNAKSIAAKNETFFARVYNPYYQVVGVLLLSVLVMSGLKMAEKWGGLTVNPSIFWVVAGTFLLFYALTNSVISLGTSENMNYYWSKSTSCYAGLMIVSGGAAWFFSGMTITEAGAFKWIFMVLTFGYLLFLSVMRFMRKVVFLAQQEDKKWQNPSK